MESTKDRCILHSDINACYASIEELYHPQLRGYPIAVCGNEDLRHGIVLAKNELAKKRGVSTGMTVKRARQICPQIYILPARMDLYKYVSKLADEVYSRYTDMHESFGIDEQWLDVTGSISKRPNGRFKTGLDIAKDIQRTIDDELGVTVSIGVSWNKVFAKLGSDYKKPNAITVINREAYQTVVRPMPVENMLYVGKNVGARLKAHGIRTIGQLADAPDLSLRRWFGENGLTLKSFAMGNDRSPVANECAQTPTKSVGNSCTAYRDLETDQDVRIMIYMITESVASRLRAQGMKGRVISIMLRDNTLHSFTRQKKLGQPWEGNTTVAKHRSDTGVSSEVEKLHLDSVRSTNSTREIAEAAYQLYLNNYVLDGSTLSGRPLRSVGVTVSDLVPASESEQISLFDGDAGRREKQSKLDACVDSIRRQYGFNSLQRGRLYTDRKLTGIDMG